MVKWSEQDTADYDALDSHIKEEFKESEGRIVAQVKLWFLTGMLGLSLTLIGGFTVVVYQVGRISERFEITLTRLLKVENETTAVATWRNEKDIIDDDLIRWARQRGYEPPNWYDSTHRTTGDSDEQG